VERWAHERFDGAVGRSLPRTAGTARIVHAWEGSALRTLSAARRLGLITILDVTASFEYAARAIGEEGGGLPPKELVRRIMCERELADFLLVPSEFVEKCLIENGADPKKMIRIPYGVDASTFTPNATVGQRPFRVLFAGQLGLRKGVKYLLEAWAKLRLPNAELVLVGSPDIHGLKLMRTYAGQFRHVPHMPLFELHHLFQSSDLFVFPSLAEGSALVTYMALAAGLPLVTTVNAGSVIRDGQEGFLVPPRDAKALGDRIAHLFNHPELRQQMGATARETVLANFTWAHYRLRIASAYKGILQGPGAHIILDPPLPFGV
jgi:glycosyltransferase involved in cell wall biosynthesis